MKAEFWRETLSNFTSPTDLVIGSPLRPTGLSGYQAQTLETQAPTIQKVAAWALLLARYNSEETVLIGMPGQEDLLPLPVQAAPGTRLEAYLEAVRQTAGMALENTLPLAEIQALSAVEAGTNLFDSAVCFPEDSRDLPLLLIDRREILEVRYDSALFDAGSISHLLGHLESILNSFESDPHLPIDRVQLLTPSEKEQILFEWNRTEIDFPAETCLHTIFEANAARLPDKTAVIFQGASLTYGELNNRANRLAHHLIDLGVGPDIPVAIFIPRSLDMAVALYGVLKAGGCYVPVDPEYPPDRIAYMLEDSRAAVLLTDARLAKALPEGAAGAAAIVRMDSDARTIASRSDQNLAIEVQSTDLAYIIYTSGSTGNPKGAMLNHQGRLNNYLDFNRRYDIAESDTVLGISSLSFDMSAYDVFGTLAAGGTTVIVEGDARLDPARWAELMVKHGVTVWHSVPALLEMLVTHIETHPNSIPNTLRLTLLGGDWIPVNLPDRIRALIPGIHNVSMGGATECSMDSTIYDIEEPSSGWKSIPYGFPMANQRCYVLDEAFNPVPVGVPGELFLGGIGVGRGYLNRPNLTAEKFLENPFVPGERIYRTGDLARYMPDGNLELLGRKDFQVKVRGYRIELGEIEAAIRDHPAVEEAIVLARQDDERGKRLVAYMLRSSDYMGTDEELDAWHSEQVSQWQEVYDSAYQTQTSAEDETFNIVSWDSSYTGQPIPAGEMRQWVETTVDRIRKHKPRRVLEIGCGTGLLLFRIAPHCETYLGTDFSRVALDYVRNNLGDLGDIVSLEHRLADNFDGIEPGSFDAVVLNSIILDFPSADYLMEVLQGAARAVSPGGTIFAGDVRSLPLQETYVSSVQLERAPGSLPAEALRQRIDQALRQEEELLVDPTFFAALPQWIPDIEDVELHLKAGDYDNEMSRFRYDVTLHIGPSKGNIPATNWLEWGQDIHSVTDIYETLSENRVPTLVRHIPNGLLVPHTSIDRLIQTTDKPVEALRADRDAALKAPKILPASIWQLENKVDMHVNLQPGAHPEFMDAVFYPKEFSKPRFANLIDINRKLKRKRPKDFCNNPLSGRLLRSLQPAIRSQLEDRLPDYMVPSAFVWLEQFPLNPNGKINRKAFPAPDSDRPDLGVAFVSPRNPIEQVLAGIWEEGLGLDRVGINDRFVSLGGHSLLATQVISRIRDIFQVELPLSYGFNATIREFSEKLVEMGRDLGIDMQVVAEVYLEISQLSDEEVLAQLESGA